MENKLQEFNSRSDFKLKVNLLNNGNIVNPRDLKWTIAHYIVTSKKVIASYDGTTLTNCELNGNDIICVFDNHNLGVGRLMREVILYIEDDAMPDGIRKEVKISTTNYRLTNTPCTKCEPVEITDNIDFSVTGTPGKDAYEVWLTLPGNAGKTKEEFFDSFKGAAGDHITIENKNFYINGNDTGIKADYSVEFAEIREIAEGIDGKIIQDLSTDTDKIVSAAVVTENIHFINVTASYPLPAGEFYTPSTARAAIPILLRKPGLEIIYATGYSNWEKERYTHSNINFWDLDNFWKSSNDFREDTRIFWKTVTPTNNLFSIDLSTVTNATLTLTSDFPLYEIQFLNLEEGKNGKLLISQSGERQISFVGDVIGGIDMTFNPHTLFIIEYFVKDSMVYVNSETIIDDIKFKAPEVISDLTLMYVDTTNLQISWTAPSANDQFDPATYYELRYSNSPVVPTTMALWSSLTRLQTNEPLAPGETETYMFTGLPSGKEFYVYVRSVRLNKGIKYVSALSNMIYARTTGTTETITPFNINIDAKDIYVQTMAYSKVNDTKATEDLMIDEPLVIETSGSRQGYPNLLNKNYTTYWVCDKYARDTSPYYLFFDLLSTYIMDKVFLYSATKLDINVYTMEKIGDAWVNRGRFTSTNNSWLEINLLGANARFIKIGFDFVVWGNTAKIPIGVEGWPAGQANGTIERINKIAIYGRNMNSIPMGIRTPKKRRVTLRPVDEWFCSNGLAYQQGRIHSLCSGPLVRTYMDYSHCAPKDSYLSPVTAEEKADPYFAYERYTDLKDFKFKLNRIFWINQNNSGYYLQNNLVETWKPYGLKPYLTGTQTFKPVFAHITPVGTNPKFKASRPLDAYWPFWTTPRWRPIPSGGVGGADLYFAETKNPLQYKVVSKLAYALASKYGFGNTLSENLPIYSYPSHPEHVEPTDVNLGIFGGLEPENEPNKNWNDWPSYESAEEFAAHHSAFFDGHCNTIEDELGNKSGYGMVNADSSLLRVGSGLVGTNPGYFLEAYLWWKANRPDKTIPVDSWSVHIYCSNAGNQTGSNPGVSYAIPFEEALQEYYGTGKLARMIEMRDAFAPEMEIWVNEFGYGESGKDDGKCKYQCYSVRGKIINNVVIPNRHRSEVKGAWIIRASIQMMAVGVDLLNYFMTINDANWFHYSGGGMYEMWDWFKETSTAPNAKYDAMILNNYQTTGDRNTFETTGLFGSDMASGCYPITISYWYVATFRNRLKGYVFTGFKEYPGDSRVVIACFRKINEEKGAYVIYLNDKENDAVINANIPVPSTITSVKKVSVYLPSIPDPRNVPSTLGIDRNRTGLPTSVRTLNSNNRVVSAILPTPEENPHFPIVGPVGAYNNVTKTYLQANQYVTQELINGVTTDVTLYDQSLQWRQVNALCDYIEFHPEGIKGSNGVETELQVFDNNFITHVTEFPEFFLFDAIPVPDYKSEISELTTITKSASEITLWWNNNNPYDTHYDIFISNEIGGNYTLKTSIAAGVQNTYTVSGLLSNTVYYFKIRPRKDASFGQMSEGVGAKTYIDIPSVSNFRCITKNASTVTLAWDYSDEGVEDFASYVIYRTIDSTFTQVAVINDRTIKSFVDTNLGSGINYVYKMRVYGTNGISSFTDELPVRTLTATEVPPVPVNSITDKLGMKFIVTFDLPLNTLPVNALDNFKLLEGENVRLIKSVSVDSLDANTLVFELFTDTLQTYDKKIPVWLEYTSINPILSEYGIAIEAFRKRVINNIGNFTNIEHTYYINFAPNSTYFVPEWNNFTSAPTIVPPQELLLQDEFGQPSNIVVKPLKRSTAPKLDWGTANVGGLGPDDIPVNAYNSFWATNAYATIEETMVARLLFSGLDKDKTYTFRAFGSSSQSSTTVIPSKIKINGKYSNSVNMMGNKNQYMVLEDLVPTTGGTLEMDLIPDMPKDVNKSVRINYLILEERSQPPYVPTDVYIRNINILEDTTGLGFVTTPNLNVNINYYGEPTHYRIGTTEDLSAVAWVAFVNPMPFVITEPFGNKTIYVQIKNASKESNIKSLTFEYRNPYVAVTLSSIIINNGATTTEANSVQVFANFSGTPTHYKIGEGVNLDGYSWLEYANNPVFFDLSPDAGVKTISMQFKDNQTTSEIKSAVIEKIVYVPLVLHAISINGGAATTETSVIGIQPTYEGNPTQYLISEYSHFPYAEWINYSSGQILFEISSLPGVHTIYLKLRDARTITPFVSDEIEKIPITETAVVSFTGSSATPAWETASNGKLINLYGLAYSTDYVRPDLKLTNGQVLGKFINNRALVTGQTLFSNSASANPTLAGNAGTYPDKYFARFNYHQSANISTNFGSILFELPAGTYTFKVYMSTSYNITGTIQAALKYKLLVNGVEETIVSCGYTTLQNNTTQYTAIPSISLAALSEVEIRCFNTAGEYNKPGFNLVEIIKVS